MSTFWIVILCIAVAAVFSLAGAFFARANGEGTDFDKWADKRDGDWDKAEDKVKEITDKVKSEFDETVLDLKNEVKDLKADIKTLLEKLAEKV